jgi:hypothetical protein
VTFRHRDTPHGADVRAAVESLRRRHKAADNARIAELLLEMVDGDPALLCAAVRFVVDRIAVRARPTMHERVARQQARTAEKAQVKVLVAQARGAVLDMIIDGRALRDLTGAEVGRLGAGFARIASRVPPGALVGAVLTESQVAALIDLKAA